MLSRIKNPNTCKKYLKHVIRSF